MNPFDLRGPQFLVFYAVFSILLIVAGVMFLRWRAARIAGDIEVRSLTDPYHIAFLRNGAGEVIRVATAALIDRGLLAYDGINVTTTDAGRNTRPRREIEQKIVARCAEPCLARSLPYDQELRATCREWEAGDPDPGILHLRASVFIVVAAVLISVSAAKFFIALGRGRTNVAYLIFLTFAAVAIASHNIAKNDDVRAGWRLVREVRNLFESLRLRAPQLQPGGASAEVALLAAAFSVSELPFPWAKTIFEPAESKDRVSSVSAASADSSSGCSSGCGGGGCGGGCGGCGS